MLQEYLRLPIKQKDESSFFTNVVHAKFCITTVLQSTNVGLNTCYSTPEFNINLGKLHDATSQKKYM